MVKLITLNVEGHAHLDRVLPFLEREQADVVCLQEVFWQDVSLFEAVAGPLVGYVSLATVNEPNPHMPELLGELGLALLSRLPVVDQGSQLYVKHGDTVPTFFFEHNANALDRALLWATVKHSPVEGQAGELFTIATTHFTWSPQGQPTSEQHRDLDELLKLTAQFPDLVFCGDFNAPRGGEVYKRLSTHFQDGIPTEILTTLDPQLHQAGPLPYVVDYVWHTPQYALGEVRTVSGVSDHQAVVAEISKG